MELEHTFTVPVPCDEAFRVLRDIERIGPCMPGATVESVEGEEFSGKVKVKVGPMQVTYKGTAAFVAVDEAAYSAVIEAKAKEARGSGTANATITATCIPRSASETQVRVVTDLSITGRPAQFGRGVMADVGEKLLGRFADCLAEELAADRRAEGPPADEGLPASPTPATAASGAGLAEASANGRRPTQAEGEAVDLLEVASGPVAKRAVPIVLALLALIVWLIRRR